MSNALLLLLVGLFMAGVGVVALVARRGEAGAVARIRRTPTTPIRDATGGLVELFGRAVASEQGTVRSALTNREGVVLSILVEKVLASASRQPWHRETHRRAFFVDDGSGELARIEPDDAILVTAAETVGDDCLGVLHHGKPTKTTVTAEMRQWIADRSGQAVPNVVRIEEELIMPGQQVYALGPSERRVGTAGSAQLVLSHRGDGDNELLLSNLDESALLGEVGTRRRKIWILIALGIACVAAGIVMTALGIGG